MDPRRFTGRLWVATIVLCMGASTTWTPAQQPTDLVCSQVDQGKVRLTWVNPQDFEGLRIFRDGAVLADVAGDATSYLDESAPVGPRVYALRPCIGGCPGTPGLGTHVVQVYLDGSTTPAAVLDVTAGNGNEFDGSYIGMGAGATGQTGAADVDFVRVALGRHAPPDAAYAAPPGGWAYAYEADAGEASSGDASGAGALDGTWSHDNGSDAWDGSSLGGVLGAGNAPGGAGILEEETDSFLRFQDPGDPRDYGYPDPSNRKIYFTHDLAAEGAGDAILDQGVTLLIRARIPTGAPIDQNHPDGGGGIVDYPAGGDGYGIHDGGKGNFGIRQRKGGIISFSLSTQADTGVAGLVMNNLNGASVTGDVDTGEAGQARAVPLDPTVWRDIWVTISGNTSTGPSCNVNVLAFIPPTGLACAQDGKAVLLTWQNPGVYSRIRILRDGAVIDEIAGNRTAYTDDAPPPGPRTYHVLPCLGETCPDTLELGTHVVKIYLDGLTTPTAILDATAGNGSDFDGSYVAVGAGATDLSGAIDVDFVRVALGKDAPVDASYPDPQGGWLYAYEAAAGEDSPGDAQGNGALDGTWSHDNGSDAWDGSGLEGNFGSDNKPGGAQILQGEDGAYIRFQDPGNPTGYPNPTASPAANYQDPSNRKLYFLHALAQEEAGGSILDGGLTLYFRARIPTDPPIDPLYVDGGGGIVPYPAGGDGYAIHSGGKGNIGIRQGAGGILSFSLATEAEYGVGALLLNKQNGNAVSGDVNTTSPGVANFVPLDPTAWHDVWVTISRNTGFTGPSCTLTVCPTEGDTTCTDLELTLIEGTTRVRATATAEDSSGDVLTYTFTAYDGVGEPIVIGPQEQTVAELELTEGEWTISVVVDDDPVCDDPPGTCSATITITTGGLQKPADANQDGMLDISDGIAILSFLFLGGPPSSLPCGDGGSADPANLAMIDANGDGGIDLSDAVWVLNWLFTGGPRPANCLDDTCPCIRIPGCPDVPVAGACE